MHVNNNLTLWSFQHSDRKIIISSREGESLKISQSRSLKELYIQTDLILSDINWIKKIGPFSNMIDRYMLELKDLFQKR